MGTRDRQLDKATLQAAVNYAKKYWDGARLKRHDNLNHCFDVYGLLSSLLFTLEIKGRDFTADTMAFLKENDILIELIQTTPYFCERVIPNNQNINGLFFIIPLVKAIGWFFKCAADRLLYIRFLELEVYDIIDIDFPRFKGWFLSNLSQFNLQYSDKTTGTINAKVPFELIPKPIIHRVERIVTP